MLRGKPQRVLGNMETWGRHSTSEGNCRDSGLKNPTHDQEKQKLPQCLLYSRLF